MFWGAVLCEGFPNYPTALEQNHVLEALWDTGITCTCSVTLGWSLALSEPQVSHLWV